MDPFDIQIMNKPESEDERRLVAMNKRKLLTGPYLVWAVAFILIPLAVILYYGLTGSDGHFYL